MTDMHDYLHQIFTYDPLTGELRNKINRGRAQAGFLHHSKNSGGYIVANVKGKQRRAQDIVWCLMTGAWPDLTVDHENTIRTDNIWTNLRKATRSQNMANRSVLGNNRLGIKGVGKVGNRYRAYIRVAGDLIHLGYFDTTVEASAAYKEAAEYVHGEFARS